MTIKDLPVVGNPVAGIDVLTGEYSDRAVYPWEKRQDVIWVRPKDEAFMFLNDTWVTVASLGQSKAASIVFRGHVFTLLEHGAKYTVREFKLADVLHATVQPNNTEHTLYYNIETNQLYRWNGTKWEPIQTPVAIKKAEEPAKVAPAPTAQAVEPQGIVGTSVVTMEKAADDAVKPEDFFVHAPHNRVYVNGAWHKPGDTFLLEGKTFLVARSFDEVPTQPLRVVEIPIDGGITILKDADVPVELAKGDYAILGTIVYAAVSAAVPSVQESVTPGVSMSETKPSIKTRVLSTVKSDSIEAAWRTAATQSVSRATGLILTAMKARKMDRKQINLAKSFFESEYGKASIAYGLGTALSQIPKKSEKVERLAKELRVMGMAAALDSVVEMGMGMLTGLVADVLTDMPEVESDAALPAPDPKENFVVKANGVEVAVESAKN